jgi:hypothetical protein
MMPEGMLPSWRRLDPAGTRTWPGLRWTTLDLGEYFDMDPGTVHGVIVPANSAVSGWSFMDPRWLANGLLRELEGDWTLWRNV